MSISKLLLIISTFSFLMGISIDVSLGDAYSLTQDLTITRNQKDDINFHADFKTNGLKTPHYYSIRLGLDNPVEFEFIHHKLYVKDDLPEEVEKFEVSDGYNLLMLNFKKYIGDAIGYRVGFGTVVTHPDIIIEGETNYVKGGGLFPKFWTDGYHWGGISSQTSVFLNRQVNDIISYHIEGKIIYANTSIPVVDGSFNLPNLSFHILVGVSFLM